jgi:hypothetical protein
LEDEAQSVVPAAREALTPEDFPQLNASYGLIAVPLQKGGDVGKDLSYKVVHGRLLFLRGPLRLLAV